MSSGSPWDEGLPGLLFIVHQLCAACTAWEELCSPHQAPPGLTREEGNLQREAEG